MSVDTNHPEQDSAKAAAPVDQPPAESVAVPAAQPAADPVTETIPSPMAEADRGPVVIPSRARSPEELDREVKRVMASRTRRSFLIGGVATVGAVAGYRWLSHADAPHQLLKPLRSAMEFNHDVSLALFRDRVLSPTYSEDRAVNMRLNGNFGQDPKMKLNTWRLQVVGLKNPSGYKQYIEDVDLWTYESGADNGDEDEAEPPSAKEAPSPKTAPVEAPEMKPAPVQMAGAAPIAPDGRPQVVQEIDVEIPIPKAPATDTSRTPGVVLSLKDLRALPSYEQVVQFKCIEGWSQITSWRGARFSDFVKAFPPAGNPKYVMMETSEGDYTCGFDFESLMHPQTLLCYEMHGRPLTIGHGAPLRLAMPIKYGYKQIKQVAKITYTNTRAVDYWENLGYDWYAGL